MSCRANRVGAVQRDKQEKQTARRVERRAMAAGWAMTAEVRAVGRHPYIETEFLDAVKAGIFPCIPSREPATGTAGSSEYVGVGR